MDRDYGPRFSLTELVEATGAPKRTVRFYIREGLLPPAQGKGRYAYYTSAHVEALTRIRELRERNLTLDEIHTILQEEQAPQPAAALEGDPWLRLALHPDAELHFRPDASEHVQAFVRQVQDFAAQWFGEPAGNESGNKWTPEG